ncbi:MAG TPA: flagellar FlbD family protein [Lacisediminihabitans sp.]|jgi:flagellar protein FlbD|nr:flagellar FlbD family protein [Lacisediminihabitans sp.]HXD62176.1 flagellar FlbD family protein [Lacisediminihabitans sp.]
MIVVTRLNDTQFAVNPDLIERINANPDTTLVMVDGAKYIVTESMTEIIDRIAQYRARVVSLAQNLAVAEQPHSGRQLGVIPFPENAADPTDAPEEPLPSRPRKL